MASTGTSRWGLEKPGTGDLTNTWGIREGLFKDAVDDITGKISFIQHDDRNSDYVLSDTDYVTSQTRAHKIHVSGLTTDVRTIVLPNKERNYILENSTQNDMIFKAGTGTITVPSRRIMAVITDGSNGIEQSIDYIPTLYVDEIHVDTRLDSDELPSNVVYTVDGTNETLQSAFGDKTGINPTRIADNHHIEGSVTQLLQVFKFEMSELYDRTSKSLTFNEANTVIHDVRVFFVRKSNGNVQPATGFYYLDINNYTIQFAWSMNDGIISIPDVGPTGIVYGIDGFNDRNSASLHANDYQVVVHVLGGRY